MLGKPTISEEERLLIEQQTLFANIKRMLTQLSKRDTIRVLLALISPTNDDAEFIKKLQAHAAKSSYVFAHKLLSIKYARMFKQIAEAREKEAAKAEKKE